jgi:hypothetical protein
VPFRQLEKSGLIKSNFAHIFRIEVLLVLKNMESVQKINSDHISDVDFQEIRQS